jgi:hypothetical protein
MRVFDVRLIVFATLILLTAAMPANCAEAPPIGRPRVHDLPTIATSAGLADVDHPGHAEAILEHAEP